MPKSKSIEQSIQARISLDSRYEQLQSASAALARPRGGWIRTIRTALGMPASELARRLGVTPSTISRLEASEIAGNINLDSLMRAAEALNCDVVYALVPRQPLKTAVQAQARRAAIEKVLRTQHTMALEEQALDSLAMSELVERKAREIAESTHLWRQGNSSGS